MDTLYSDKSNQMVKLAKIRKEKRITLIDMAFEIGVSKTTLHRYETGKREIPYKIYVKYAEKLGFEVRELLK